MGIPALNPNRTSSVNTRALLRSIVLSCLGFLYCTYSPAQQANAPQDTTPKFEVNVNRVLVPVVVRDKQGRTVPDLKQEDFQVYDNGKPRTISALNVERRGIQNINAVGNPASPSSPSATADTVSKPSVLPDRIKVFLFDDMHMSFDDLTYARKAGVKELAGTLTGSDMAAVVSTSGKVNSGLTSDPAKLQQALMSLSPRPSDKSDCPLIDYYQADLMLNKHSAEAAQDAVAQVLNCDPGINPQTDLPVAQRLAEAAARRALAMGAQDVQATLATTSEIVRRMAKLPGQRTLILVSSGFSAIEQESRTEESRLMDLAAQSNVTISALDARGLYTTALVASDDTHVVPVQSRSEFHASAMKANENIMAELADGTGGTFFHNSNDLDAGLKALTEAPEVVYVLELSLDGVKSDGTYHRLQVKVDRDGLDLQARRGYFMPKPEKNKK
jgi:VWFA-related protein